MQPIPDTGPGIWGFFAHLLWQVYAWFPSAGRYDWVLLMLAMGLATYAVYVPWLWRGTAFDIRTLKDGSSGPMAGDIAVAVPAMMTLYVLLWFFHTSSGKTFLAGRGAWWISAPTEVSRVIYWLVLVLVIATLVTAMLLSDAVDKRNRALGASRSQAYPDRSFISLFGQGGVYIVDLGGVTKPDAQLGVLAWATMGLFFPLVFYWYWSVASLVLMLCFVLAAGGAEACRMWFVCIHHKRTFG